MTFHLERDALPCLVKKLKDMAQRRPQSLILPEAHDGRVQEAAAYLLKHGCVSRVICPAKPVAALDDERVLSFAATYPQLSQNLKAKLSANAAAKGRALAPDQIESLSQDALVQAGYLLHLGQGAACVAGCLSPTADVIRAAIRTVGLRPGMASLSGAFVLERADEVFLFADTAIIVDPDVDKLVTIAASSVASWRQLFPDIEPVLAFLSFSTKGSAQHPDSEKMAAAAAAFQAAYPGIVCDGELQFDAAFSSAVGRQKAPGSPVPGRANICIFPDLGAGNIGYKIAQRLGGFRAYGPLLQGAAKPYLDLSRGADAADIVSTCLIALALAAT